MSRCGPTVSELARVAGVEVVELHEDSAGELKSWVAAAAADVLVASNWRWRVPSEVLSVVPMGGINVHDALLPRYGGFAPLNWAIARGEVEVGLTTHIMSRVIDLGDVIVQERLPVGPDETVREVAERISERVGPVTVGALDRITTPGFAPVPQSRVLSTMFHRRTVADSRIDWGRPAREVHDLVRAQVDPLPERVHFPRGAGWRSSGRPCPAGPTAAPLVAWPAWPGAAWS
jgi:methionyl-tRNA formyltransferase